MTRKKVGLAGVVFACMMVLPAMARAQSSINGTVKDTSDAVLPGVTVKITSPAMIEGSKEVTTDGSGQYRFVDLRPGIYAVTFTLEGFTTVERTAYQLLSDFNARLDAQLKVGSLNETITVTGAAPIVDVQSAAHVAVLDRDAIDNVPTGRTIQGLGQLILGVSLNAPDVGGSAAAMQTYMSLRGGAVSSQQNTLMVDGMVINGFQSNGGVLPYSNDANFQEMTYQTAGIGAENSAGGVTMNMVPKEGGNRFSGSGNAAVRPGGLQGNNYSDRFKEWGLPVDKNGEPAINRIDHIWDFNISEGGPVMKDRLWFFTSARSLEPVNTVPNTFLDDGTQGVDDNYVRNVSLRLTYQASPKHKISAYYDRSFKWRGHSMNPLSDPETTASVWTSPNRGTGSFKYTGTLSSKLLIEGGFSQNTEYYRTDYQPEDAASNKATYGDICCGSGIAKEMYTPAWYAYAAHTTIGGGGSGVAAAPPVPYTQFPLSQVYQGSASYVTGRHHAKIGFALKTGKFLQEGNSNAHLTQQYPSSFRDENYNTTFPTQSLSDAEFAAKFGPGTIANFTTRPCNPTNGTITQCRASVNNFPLSYQTSLNHDLGIYIQDSFTINRFTISGGIRYESLNAQVDPTEVGAGRWVPARVGRLREDIPDWADWAPRFQLVYDVFGDSKTAVKYSFNRYNDAQTTGLAETVNPLTVSTNNPRFWTDLNNDDVAQGSRTWTDGCANPSAANCINDKTYVDCVYLSPGCEINLSGTTGQAAFPGDFGTVGSGATYTNFPRRYRLEHGFEVQHALLPRLSLSGTYYHGENKNITKTISTAQTDNGTQGTQYRQLPLFNPIDGTPYTYYALLGPAFPGSSNVIYVEPKIKSQYDAYSAEVRMRPYAGAQLGGGIELARTLTRDCESSYIKTDGTTALINPNSLRFCDQWNMVAFDGGPKIGKPFTKNFKLSGAFPVVYGLNLGVSYQNIDAGGLSPTFLYGSARQYPNGTQTMLGGSTPIPACPTAYGCVPGAAAWVAGPGTEPTAAVGSQFGSGAIAEERIVQLDFKVSKNLRFGRYSVQPLFEAFNVMNIDQVQGRTSSQYAISTGGYLQPNNMLQGRVLGFGATVKW